MACYEPIAYGPSVDIIDPLTGKINQATNAIIPVTGKPSVTMRAVYADDNVTIAYYSYELKFESIIYAPVSVLQDIDAEVTRLRNILSTPGLKLKLSPTGLGTFPIINSPNGTPDLTGGPRISEISVEPFATNDAIAISGSMSFDIKHCSPLLPGDPIQYNSELDMQVDDNGNISFKIFTTYQSRSPITNKTAINDLAKHIRRDAGKLFQGLKKKTRVSYSRDQRIAHIEVTFTDPGSDAAFAPLTKHIDFTDTMESSLMDQEGMGTGGFYKWMRSFSGTITLPPRVNKIWAWYVFRQIVIDRLKGVKLLLKTEAEVDTEIPANQKDSVTNKVQQKPSWYVPLKLSFTNNVYSRTFSFDFHYLFVMDLETIMQGKANLFATARHNISVDNVGEFEFNDPNNEEGNPPKPVPDISDEWFVWDANDNYDLNSFYRMESAGPILVAQCSPSSTPNQGFVTNPNMRVASTRSSIDLYEQEPEYEDPKSPSASDVKQAYRHILGSNSDSRLSWLAYDNKITIMQENENEQISFLQTTPNDYYRAKEFVGSEPVSPTSATQGFVLDHNPGNVDFGYETPKTVSFGPSTYKIRMQGSAMRIGYKIPTPAIISASGFAVTRTGESRYSHQMVSQSNILNEMGESPNQSSIKLPVYLAMWDITYNVESGLKAADILSTIKSSGSPGAYV